MTQNPDQEPHIPRSAYVKVYSDLCADSNDGKIRKAIKKPFVGVQAQRAVLMDDLVDVQAIRPRVPIIGIPLPSIMDMRRAEPLITGGSVASGLMMMGVAPSTSLIAGGIATAMDYADRKGERAKTLAGITRVNTEKSFIGQSGMNLVAKGLYLFGTTGLRVIARGLPGATLAPHIGMDPAMGCASLGLLTTGVIEVGDITHRSVQETANKLGGNG